jgi:hypothetical protein
MALMIPDPGGVDACEGDSISQGGTCLPCPLSIVPTHKYEGASGDMYENKGTGKMALMIPAPGGVDACEGDSISQTGTCLPCPLSRVPCPDSQI